MSEPTHDRYAAQAQPDWRPIPDPTTLTTDQLRRELGSLRELIESRLSAMDKAAELLSETVNRTPTEIQKQITHVRELIEEQFGSVDQRFIERDTRTDQAAKASKEALDAALLAAKELVSQQNEANAQAADKAEQSTIKQIDQIGIRIDTTQKGLEDRLTELKERVDRGEGGQVGAADVRDATATQVNQRLVALGIVISVVVVVINVVIALIIHR